MALVALWRYNESKASVTSFARELAREVIHLSSSLNLRSFSVYKVGLKLSIAM